MGPIRFGFDLGFVLYYCRCCVVRGCDVAGSNLVRCYMILDWFVGVDASGLVVHVRLRLWRSLLFFCVDLRGGFVWGMGWLVCWDWSVRFLVVWDLWVTDSVDLWPFMFLFDWGWRDWIDSSWCDLCVVKIGLWCLRFWWIGCEIVCLQVAWWILGRDELCDSSCNGFYELFCRLWMNIVLYDSSLFTMNFGPLSLASAVVFIVLYLGLRVC